MIQFQAIEAHDFGPLERLKLQLSKRGLVLIRGENNDSAAADSNGAGKSHIFKAISWCLFGDNVDGDKGDEVIRHGAKLSIVGVSWNDDGAEWSVVRQKGRGSSAALKLFHAGEDVSAMTMAATQLEIHRRLGMDWQSFRNTVLYGQGDLVRFADPLTTDAERKLILKRILRLEVLDKALEQARQRLRKHESDRSDINSKLAGAEGELSAIPSGDSLEATVAELEAEAVELERQAARAPKIKKVLDGIQAHLVGLVKVREELDGVNRVLTETRQMVAKHTAEQAAFKREQSRIEAQISTLEGGACPTCGSPSTSTHVKRKLGDLRAALGIEGGNVAQAQADGQAASERVTLEQARGKELQAQLDGASDWRSKQGQLSQELKQAGSAAVDAKKKRDQASKLSDELKAQEAKAEEIQATIDGLKSTLEALESEHSYLDFWVKGFGNAGLPSYLMDEIIPQLAERANHYLETLADGDIRVDFDTHSKLKSGELREKLSINWTIEGMPGVTPSGGQRKKISVAVDLALMDLVAARERAAIDLLMLDEVLDGLDATGKSRVVDLLQELRQRRSTILVVSHDPGLAEMFENVITVVKQGGLSTIAA